LAGLISKHILCCLQIGDWNSLFLFFFWNYLFIAFAYTLKCWPSHLQIPDIVIGGNRSVGWLYRLKITYHVVW